MSTQTQHENGAGVALDYAPIGKRP